MPFARSAFLLILSLAASTSWAAGGWYLLVPPMSDYNERAEFLYGIDILNKKPLAQWAQETAYDSASACETAKTQRVRIASIERDDVELDGLLGRNFLNDFHVSFDNRAGTVTLTPRAR